MMMMAALLALAASPPPGLEIQVVRFYRGGTTLVDAFCRVPFDGLGSLAGGAASYRIQVTVRDSSGLVLTESSWSQSVRDEVAKVPGAAAVEHFAFAAQRGRYSVEVVVTDSASGNATRTTTGVEAYAAVPRASDLVLTSSIRRVVGSDSVGRAGEVRKGAVFVLGATHPVLTPQQGQLFYYLELYPGSATQAELTARVTGSDGHQVFAAPPQVRSVGAGGGVATSAVDLAGLPPGEYTLNLGVKYADTVLVRSGGFAVVGFEVAAAAAQVTAADEYDGYREAALDSLYRPLVHVMEDGERGMYESLSVEGKRNYLRRFWAKRDPTSATPENEAKDSYYGRIAEANRRFREGGSGQVQGWNTDRGRVLLRYGEPDERLNRPQSGTTPPYEVWKYTRGRARKFVFLDETRFGHYALLYTDERREPSRPDWEAVLGTEAAKDVKGF